MALEEEIKNWYMDVYPGDDFLFDDLRPGVTFQDALDTLENGGDIYEFMFVNGGDSVVRERVFEYLSDITGKPYDYFYDLWLANA